MSDTRVIAATTPRPSMIVPALAVIVLALSAGRAGAQSLAVGGPWIAPDRAAHQTNPTPPSSDAIKAGQKIFKSECERCHGPAGHGDGAQAKFLTTKPADLTGDAIQSQSDGALFYKITEGRGQMPKAIALNDKEKWLVIDYLRAITPKK